MFSVSHSNQGNLFENIVAQPIAYGVLAGTAAAITTYAFPALFPINPLIAGVFIATIEVLSVISYKFFSYFLSDAVGCSSQNNPCTYWLARFVSIYIGLTYAPLTLPYTLKITSVALSALQTVSLYALSEFAVGFTIGLFGHNNAISKI